MCSSSTSSSSQLSNSLSTKKSKNPFMRNYEIKASYRNLYHREWSVHLESTEAKYRLKPEEILGNLSVQFLLELCAVVVDSVSSKCAYNHRQTVCDSKACIRCCTYIEFDVLLSAPSEYEEFIRLMHEIVFAPSVLKSDDRSADEILSSVLNTLQRNQSSPKKFIQISYQVFVNELLISKPQKSLKLDFDWECAVFSQNGENCEMRLTRG